MNTNDAPTLITVKDIKLNDRVAVLWNDLEFVGGFDAMVARGPITEIGDSWFRVNDGEDSSIVFHNAIIELRRF